jgi:diphthamide synthase (EF-2-diphthine--ammonia ligase)
MLRPKAAVSWSGGKDSYLALHRAAVSFDIQPS